MQKKERKRRKTKKNREFFLTRAERSGTYIDKAKICKGPPAVDNSKGGSQGTGMKGRDDLVCLSPMALLIL